MIRRLVRRDVSEAEPYRPYSPRAVQMAIKQGDGIPQSFLIMSGDTVRLDLRSMTVGGKDFRLITTPVEIQARCA